MTSIPKFPVADLDSICRVLAPAVSHKNLSILLHDCQIEEKDGNPRWERMLQALTFRQNQDDCANNVIAFFQAVLNPSRFRDNLMEFEQVRGEVNFYLAFHSIQIGEDGKARPAQRATTISEAAQRASELREELRRREVHPDVITFCREELLLQNYFHCVLEASKSLAQKIRDKTGLTQDGGPLVDTAFSVKNPKLALNQLTTETEQMEQKGFTNLLKGIFGTFRNVTAHGPKVYWSINKRDAMDALTLISYAHRRVDDSICVP